MVYYKLLILRHLLKNEVIHGTKTTTFKVQLAEMFEERTSIPVKQVVILVVTEDGTVQEFVR